MVSIIVILGVVILVGLVVGGLIWAVREDMSAEGGSASGGKEANPSTSSGQAEALEEFNKQRAEERAGNKEKILKLLEQKGKVVNKDVEGLLSVADATATRYLDELEKEGKIKQEGTDGQYVYYSKI